MSADKNIDRVCRAVLIAAILLTVLFMNGESLGIRAVADEDAETYTGNAYFTSNDLNGSWDTAHAVRITLNGDSASIRGNGAYFNNGTLTIKNGGYYVISGELTDGSITVDAYDSSKVWIMLSGVSVNCEDNAAVIVKKADKVFLTLAEGTENVFTSGEAYSEEALEINTNAVIWSKEDLTINGTGTLRVNGSYKHGIKCNDSLVITGGEISVGCPGDGIHANDSIAVTGADISIEAGDDALRCEMKIYIQDGRITIPECYEGIEAPLVEIAGGEIKISPIDDGINANTVPPESGAESVSSEESGLVHITGGNITIISENGRDSDGIDSNGDIVIDGGEIFISLGGFQNNALDFGSESGGSLYLNGGTVTAAAGSAMFEPASAESRQGSITILTAEEMAAGSVVTVTDAEDEVILEREIPCGFTAVTLSCKEMAVGGTYTVRIGDEYSQKIALDAVTITSGDGMVGFGGAHGRVSGIG